MTNAATPPCDYRPCSHLAAWQTYTSSTQWRFCDEHATKTERAHTRAGLYFRKFRLT